MRENRTYGSEGGVATSHPYPYHGNQPPTAVAALQACCGTVADNLAHALLMAAVGPGLRRMTETRDRGKPLSLLITSVRLSG
jgi:hypothetical protein